MRLRILLGEVHGRLDEDLLKQQDIGTVPATKDALLTRLADVTPLTRRQGISTYTMRTIAKPAVTALSSSIVPLDERAAMDTGNLEERQGVVGVLVCHAAERTNVQVPMRMSEAVPVAVPGSIEVTKSVHPPDRDR